MSSSLPAANSARLHAPLALLPVLSLLSVPSAPARLRRALCYGMLSLGVMGATIALAADQDAEDIPEIIVTAEYRDVPLDQFAGSAAVLGEEEIDRRSATHLEELLNVVPNLNFAAGASRARYFQIRGIGERGQFGEPLNPSVGVIIDGVDFSGIGTVATLIDVGQVEVLRGPQGTLFGANALAGLINLRTNPVRAEPELEFSGEASDYNTWQLGVVAGGALSDTVSGRFSAQVLRSDGFIENHFSGDETSERDEKTLRGKLQWQPTHSLTIDAAVGYVDVDNGYDAFSLDFDRRPSSDEPGRDAQRSTWLSLGGRYSAIAAFDIEAQITGVDSDIDYGYDEDWSFVGFHPFEYSSTDRYEREREQFSAELRLVSKPDGRLFNDTTDWVVGIYGINQEVALDRTYTFLPGPFSSDFDTRRLAVFGQLDTELNNNLTLTVGLRFANRDAEYDDSEGVSFDPDEDLWGGKIALSWLIDDGPMVYGSVSRGYKAGGVNTDGNLTPELREFDSEQAINYELGAKGELLDGALTYRVAAFYMDRDDVQISNSRSIVRPDGSTEFVQFLDNATDGENQGIEVDVNWYPRDDVHVFFAGGILDTEYGSFVSVCGVDLDGREQAHAPDYQLFAGAEYSFLPGWYARVEVEAKDKFFFSDCHSSESESFEVVNARIGYEAEHWSVALWTRNAFDEDYATRGFEFGNDPRNNYANSTYFQLGEPRRVGVTFKYSVQ